jgi:2-octaprenyl-6-methoxyphenol hydroxylase
MKFDIAIVGGGMVGAALAAALHDTSLKIALIDAAESHANDHRLIALNYASYAFFKKINIWSELENHASAIHQVHVSTRGHFGTTRISAKEMGVEQLGFVVPAKEINIALYKKLTELNHVTILRGAKLTSLSQHTTHVDLTLAPKTEMIEAAIVIGADGTFSTVRELLQIPTEIIDYQQKALVTITKLKRSHQHVAYERFLAKGAIAMLPLTGERAATIWSGDEKRIDELLKLSDEDFVASLQENFGFRLGKFLKIEERFSYPLKFSKSKAQIKNRVMLIGNAAHTVHPIAAQGLNLALYEVDVLAAHFKQQLSLTDLPNFNMQQKVSVNLSHRLTELFSADFFIVNAGRQLGMIGLDVCSSAKKQFGKRVLGLIKPTEI